MRGRLIHRFVCVLRRLDAAATSAVLGGGYDDIWRTTKPVDDGTQTGATSRREEAAIRIPCQLDRRSWGRINPKPSGNEIDADIIITLHWPDLVTAGLIAGNGTPLIQQGDRIEAIETRLGAVEETFDDPPGMYVYALERAGLGLNAFGTPRTNLLFLYCNFGQVSV